MLFSQNERADSSGADLTVDRLHLCVCLCEGGLTLCNCAVSEQNNKTI